MVALIVQLVPTIFGSYLWYNADGVKDETLGQTAMINSILVLLPYMASLILLGISMDYVKSDLEIVFAGKPGAKFEQMVRNLSRNQYENLDITVL